ncbi:peptidoglycan DD-metalloendopeptidase family protein [Nocardiopsis salina]|uniref:peptidoglycan DD-metalloendopeptidase family protein n=1 Tax=Nocardiopsis salina TaxID=245836 RepID=UPI00036FF851|nr:peptidoglycan DD-metalloendopeptidase family protein [Nocardiopsis salina]
MAQGARAVDMGRRRLRWRLISVLVRNVPVLVPILLAVVAADLVFGGIVGAWFPVVVALAMAVHVVLLLALRSLRDESSRGPVETAAPVAGEWFALNGPSDKVPSHGVRFLGQEYAIDVLIDSQERPTSPWWPPMSRSGVFPAFGQPLFAPADAEVVHVEDGARDHLSRGTYAGLAYFLVEGLVRQAVGARRVLGNHVVLDLGGGVYALYAHLRQGSARVGAGEKVRAGQVLAECGNSGNSSEPHLHFQLMDAPDPRLAVGMPFTWTGVGVPENGSAFHVPEHT